MTLRSRTGRAKLKIDEQSGNQHRRPKRTIFTLIKKRETKKEIYKLINNIFFFNIFQHFFFSTFSIN